MYQSGLTKYQKTIVKALTQLIGRSRPFRYEKCTSNHLKVFIKGVPEPLFTGSTPSDRKAKENFMSLVKKEIKKAEESENQSLMQTESESDETAEKGEIASQRDLAELKMMNKISDYAVKSLQNRISAIQKIEEEQAKQRADLSELKAVRIEEIKKLLQKNLHDLRHQYQYLKPKQIKWLEKELLEHANFMLPTIADYAQQLKITDVEKTPLAPEESLPAQPHLPAKNEAIAPESTLIPPSSSEIKKQTLEESLEQIMKINDYNRIKLFRNLSKAQLLQLSDNAEKAMQFNYEQDLKEIMTLIKAKDIDHDELIELLQKTGNKA